MVFSFYSPANAKISEATVFSSRESSQARIVVDTRDGARHSIAIANITDYNRYYTLALAAGGVTRTAQIFVPARRNLAAFVDSFIPVPANTLGVLTIQANDYSYFAAIGFRVTGGVFTTIPAGN